MSDAVAVPTGRFYLGGSPGEGVAEPLFLKSSDLTTHGVIVGMTGSGKTGLGVVLLEEVLLSGLPTVVLDPKGDMGNLMLAFPALRGADFEPWVNTQEATRKGQSLVAFAQSTADVWREGLADWGISPERIARLRQAADFTLYTPGSTAGVPLNIIGSLQAPARGGDIEAVRDEVEGYVSSLLALVGIHGDPLSCREHILLANLIEYAWGQGKDLDLALLLGQVQNPPMRRLGVIELDTFFPKKDRLELVMKLNGLLASPAFGAWMDGPALDIERMLYTAERKPRAAVISLAHLSDEERQFVVTLILSKLVTWMRSQPGSDGLRALVYMDEVFGFVPPTKAPPSKKPILTILKQARAFGIGMVLATQNPVDLDYKALSNAGTWMVGRLQTERDKARLIDGLLSAGGSARRQEIEALISGLGKRQFLHHSTKSATPHVFQTRWAMSYLRGPMTRNEISRLSAHAPERKEEAAQARIGLDSEAFAEGQPLAPETATDTPVYYLDAAADWGALPGVVQGSTRLEAAVAVRVRLLFDDDKAELKHTEEWEAVFHPLSVSVSGEEATAVDYDDRDLVQEPPAGATYLLPDAPIHTSTFFRNIGRSIKDHLYQTHTFEILRNPALGLYSRIGETSEDFAARCRKAAEKGEDAVADKLRAQYEKRIDKGREMLARAQDRLKELEVNQSTRKTDELVSGVGTLLTAFFGGRRGTRSLASGLRSAASKRSQTRRSSQRLETAGHKVEDRVEALERLEEELADALISIDDEWEEKAHDIEPVEISLEKMDITITDISLVWIPV